MKVLLSTISLGLLSFGGCSNEHSEPKSLTEITNLSASGLVDAYEKLAASPGFSSVIEQFGAEGWAAQSANTSLSSLSVDGAVSHLELIAPSRIAKDNETLKRTFGTKSAYWKQIGFDPKAKITVSDIGEGAKAMNKIVTSLTGHVANARALNLSPKEQRAFQSLKLAMRALSYQSSLAGQGALGLVGSSEREPGTAADYNARANKNWRNVPDFILGLYQGMGADGKKCMLQVQADNMGVSFATKIADYAWRETYHHDSNNQWDFIRALDIGGRSFVLHDGNDDSSQQDTRTLQPIIDAVKNGGKNGTLYDALGHVDQYERNSTINWDKSGVTSFKQDGHDKVLGVPMPNNSKEFDCQGMSRLDGVN